MTELKPLLKIEGPPGSGKTRMLAREACRLVVEEGLAPSQVLILAMTSMNKHRLQAYLKSEARQAGLLDITFLVTTWEEWLLSLLKAGEKNALVSLLSDADARILLQEVLRQLIQPGHVLYYASRQASFAHVVYELIRQLQLHGMTEAQLDTLLAQNQSFADERLPLVAEVFRVFRQRLQVANLMCHPELLQQALDRIIQNPGLISRPYRAIFLDEAQELSALQHHMLASLPCQLVLAGNEKLSIRSFRGAAPELFETLASYENHQVTFLPQQACLRSNEAILTLLNGFLENPLWEEQQPNRAQLEEMVQFGLCSDANQEAYSVARWIVDVVNTTSVDDRPAQWDDCVILLRSAHYQPHLVQALMHHNIPFRSEVVSDALIRFQHVYYDLLQVFHALEQLAITPELLQSVPALEKHLADCRLPIVTQRELCRDSNRHLRRWLETAVSNQDDDSNVLASLQATLLTEETWLLPQLLDSQAIPPVLYAAAQSLIAMYAAYFNSLCPVALLDDVVRQFKMLSHTLGEEEHDAEGLQLGLDACQQNLERLNQHYQTTFGRSLPLGDIVNSFASLWDGIDGATNSGVGAVRLLSIHQVQGEEFPFVAIPFLVGGEFPHTRDIPEVLSDTERQLLGIPLAYQINEAEESRLLAVGMSRAMQRLLLSCHEVDEGSLILPSAFYQRLLSRKREILGGPISAALCLASGLAADACDLAICQYHSAGESVALEDSGASGSLLNRYVGESAWAKLQKEAKSPLFDLQETVSLSASSMKTYMTCPRQFYYRHLLRLPQVGNEAASLGSLIHRVMEVFNTQATTQPYTASRLKMLAETMFLFKEDPDAFFAIGFQDDDLHELRKLSPLSLSTLRQRLLESIDDLERKGYFERYSTLKQVQPEKRLDSFQVEGIERCRFSGTIDALVQLADGRWELIDYKTFRNAYSVGVDTCDKRFRETLDPLPEDEDLTHAERFASKMSGAYPKDYQLPLYYLACEQDPAYRGQLSSVALQIVRPGFPDNPAQGSIRLELSAEAIEASKQRLVEDIRRYIVDPILGSEVFETNPSRMTCTGCGYYSICDSDSDIEEAGDA